MENKNSSVLGWATVVGAVGTVALAVAAWWPPPDPPAEHIYVKDDAGLPCTELVVVGPEGRSIPTDERGTAPLLQGWKDATLSIRKRIDQSEVLTIRVGEIEGDFLRVTLPGCGSKAP